MQPRLFSCGRVAGGKNNGEGRMFGAKDVKEMRGEVFSVKSAVYSENNYVCSIERKGCSPRPKICSKSGEVIMGPLDDHSGEGCWGQSSRTWTLKQLEFSKEQRGT